MGKTSVSGVLSGLLCTALITMVACTPPPLDEPMGSQEQVDPEGEVVTLYVGPERVDCVGVAPQRCLLVRETAETDYSYFYSTIEGFDYEPGYEYELLVEKTPVENPPADGSSIRWMLIEVVEKVPVDSMELF
jgi:hypothetical protein